MKTNSFLIASLFVIVAIMIIIYYYQNADGSHIFVGSWELCVPEKHVEGHYACNWTINYVYSLQDLPDETYGLLKEGWEEKGTVGFADYTLKQIYIEAHAANFWQPLGCTTLWHEILHAWGYMHEEMSLCPYSYQDHIQKTKRLNFYQNPDLPMPDVPDDDGNLKIRSLPPHP